MQELIMNNRIILPLLIILFSVFSLFATNVEKVYKNKHGHYNCLEDVDIEIEDDVLILTCHYDRDQWIEITPDRELSVSSNRIDLTRYQRRLVGAYYDHFIEIIERATEIGKEGAKIGLKGAKVGLLAAQGAMKMIITDYDEDDFEKDIEEETEKLELRTDKLEEMADELEEIADEFEDIHYTMKSDIDELNDLDWF
jgi:hypothetical protein